MYEVSNCHVSIHNFILDFLSLTAFNNSIIARLTYHFGSQVLTSLPFLNYRHKYNTESESRIMLQNIAKGKKLIMLKSKIEINLKVFRASMG